MRLPHHTNATALNAGLKEPGSLLSGGFPYNRQASSFGIENQADAPDINRIGPAT